MMVSRGLIAVVALISAGLPALIKALSEDEVGQYEWIVQQVGQPTALAYSTDAADKVFVASASGVLASMLLKDGSVQWRRVSTQSAEGGGMRLLKAGTRGLLSVTGSGLVQFWKGSTGDLTWQREYPDKVVDLHMVGPVTKQNVVVVRESEIEVRTTAGKHEWSAPAGKDARYWVAALAQSEKMICAVSSRMDGAGAQAVQIEDGTGKVLKTSPMPASIAKPLESGSYIVVDSHLVVLAGDAISVHSICGAKTEGDSTFAMSKIKSTGKVPFQLMPWQRTPGVFAATNGVSTAIFGLTSKGLKHLRTFDGVAVVGPVHTVHDDEAGQPVAVAIVGSEGTKIQLLDPASGNVQPAMNAEGYTAKDHGPARLLLVRELSSGKHHTVISAADHSLVGMQGSEVKWVREEALATIKQAVFYARASNVKPRRKEDGSLGAAIGAQLSQLPAFMANLAKMPAEIAAAAKNYVDNLGRPPKRSKPTLLANGKTPSAAEELSGFGANKLVLCATSAHKLFALEATTSEIVWQRYFANGAELLDGASGACVDGDRSAGRCGLWMKLLPSSSALYSELIVVTPTPGDASHAPQHIHWVDPLTGKDVHSQASPSSAGIVSLMPLPRNQATDLEPKQPFLLLDTKHKVHLLPGGNAENEQRLEKNIDRLFHFDVNRRAQVVEGYSINKESKGNGLLRLWNLELDSLSGERIVAAATPEHREWDHVPVHIKGDASILYKYINTNMLSMVSTSMSKGNKTQLNLYVMDSVTGHVVHQTRIAGGAGPVHMVLCDNWVLIHYWNELRTRFELTVVELFESKHDDGPWNILFSENQNHTISAHHMENPVALQQTYIFPTGVTAMGVTATGKGITPRSVVMALTTDHLLTISKDILNPRRPYMLPGGGVDKEKSIPSQFAPTKEEPIPPYQPVMPLMPKDVLTYYNPMTQVAGMTSSPTALESTSLVFAYGLDLFFTPVQTAKAYDVLSPGFNYSLLYVSVGSVVALLVGSTLISSRRTLSDRWK